MPPDPFVDAMPAGTARAPHADLWASRSILRLRSGRELTGMVREATARLVVLGAVSGREFFDAVIPLEAVDAVLVRTKQ